MASIQSTCDFSRYGMLLAIPGGILYLQQCHACIQLCLALSFQYNLSFAAFPVEFGGLNVYKALLAHYSHTYPWRISGIKLSKAPLPKYY